MRRVLSISLGSSSGDKIAHTRILGEQFELERRGTDGDLARFAREMRDNDGKVDALAVGGANLALHWGHRTYPIRDIVRATRAVTQTPVVDGATVKDTLEREAIRVLCDQGVLDFSAMNVLLVCAVDRFGMAEEIAKRSRRYVFGDVMFNLGLPWAVRSKRTLDVLAFLLLPILVRTPFRWLYPTGAKQDAVVPKWEKWYRWADVIAGDFPMIRRHMPQDLSGKIVLTQSTTEHDVEQLRRRGARLLVTATPVVEGRAFATNVLEGVFVCILGKRPEECTREEFVELAQRIGWQPTVRELGGPGTAGRWSAPQEVGSL